MKYYNVFGTFEVAIAYDMETELEIDLKNDGLGVNEWAEDTGRLTGAVVIRDLNFDVTLEAENEEEAKRLVLADLEEGWDFEEGVELKEVNLITIDVTEEVDWTIDEELD